jgi:hypothetical protein
MSAEILNAIPTSGQFTERHFGEHFNSQLWVKFTDNNFQEWVGCFSKSYDNALCLALTDENNLTSFVIAGGQGYLIDIDKKEIITELDEQPLIESVIRTTSPNYFIAGTFYSIYILNETGLIKEIRPDKIIDGIYFKSQLDNKAIGDLATAENQYDYNVDFEFDLTTFELQLNYKTKQGLFEKLWNKFTN